MKSDKIKYVAYQFDDMSVGIFILVKEKKPYDQMEVKFIEDGLPLDLYNYRTYKICNTLEEANNIKTESDKIRKNIIEGKNKLNKLFK